MRILYHKDILFDIFSGNIVLNDYERSVVNSSGIILTSEIVNDYNSRFGDNQIYRDWISSLFSYKMIENVESYIIKREISENFVSLDHYEIGSYYSDQEVISAKIVNSKINSISIKTTLKEFVSTRRNCKNPYKTVIMESNGNAGFDLFERYLKIEKEIYIYDQYINSKSKIFLKYIKDNVSADAYVKVFLFEEGGNCFSAEELNREFNSGKFKFYKVKGSTAARIHDRFINFGKRIQVTFSKGLDQFNPLLKNRIIIYENCDSVISFFDILNSDKKYLIESVNGLKIEIPKRY
ncbi:hypothetical protein [Delftia acidovorans]|uniref:Uncharacterized protein n=1 Tax=Delftia acidovorans TaxID=80866 RepID=A0AAJ2R2E1_DELAC|nr:hypothetical protein [Delftia acidovorans]MDX4956421.1 hypothetical protein [Delftia acidovorans]